MLLLTLLTACSNSGLGQPTTTPTADTGATVVVDECPWVGRWTLRSVKCSTFDFAEWYDDHTGATLDIAQADQGGCDVVATVSGATCEESESWHFTSPVGINVDLTYNGISACNPDACTFNGPDAPCQVGDRAGGTETISVDDATGELQMVGALADTAPGCTLDIVTVWAP